VEKTGINNRFYEELGASWHSRNDHPIALLRAENRVRNPWIEAVLKSRFAHGRVLDIGCGGGFLANALSAKGWSVAGVDLSRSTLEQARRVDATQRVDYREADAYNLPFENGSFEAVAAMDLLEHVEDPRRVVAEAARVLKPNGCFFFHTFNRNLLSYFLVIKGVEWFIPNTPPRMHVYSLFIKPKELQEMARTQSMEVVEMRGLAPQLSLDAAVHILWKRAVPPDFKFRFSKSLLSGYCGYAIKKNK
jgi:2-polyprenyl-6-hydroxyphenyl methylase/3-demethylubiquinone-9 3-methyltransferase